MACSKNHESPPSQTMPNPAYTQAFIDAHLATARDIQRRYGIPAGILLAQSALETGWGRKVVGNAYLGMKGAAPGGSSATFATHEYVNGTRVSEQGTFRAYTGFDDAAEDWAKQIRDNPRFRECYLRQRTITCAMILAHGGYGTDPRYGAKLLSIIRAHNLDQYDTTAPQ